MLLPLASPEAGSGFQVGLALYAGIVVYLSLLGAYVLIKTRIVGLKGAAIIVISAISFWAASLLMYFSLPVTTAMLVKTVLADAVIVLAIIIYAKFRKTGDAKIKIEKGKKGDMDVR